MKREPTVWLLQESWSHNVDLSSANRYGRVIPILGATDHPGRAPGPSLAKLKGALRDYRADLDYVAYGLSDPAAAFLAGMVFAKEDLLREPINWLRWERERQEGIRASSGGFYTPTQISYL